MINAHGAPRVLEFNVRMGDPETQPILFRLDSDLLDLLEAAIDGRLDQTTMQWNPQPSVGVVMAAAGYPGAIRKHDVIRGLDAVPADAKVFHAGTQLRDDGEVVTSGGRVLCVVARGATVREAQRRAYVAIDAIRWDGVQYRRDIGYRAIARED
jgi:phosphoribosylamine--glycine ligase